MTPSPSTGQTEQARQIAETLTRIVDWESVSAAEWFSEAAHTHIEAALSAASAAKDEEITRLTAELDLFRQDQWVATYARLLRESQARVAALEQALRGVQSTSRNNCWCDTAHDITADHQPKCQVARGAFVVPTHV